jgi:two-component system sensor histidine kinase UhpB
MISSIRRRVWTSAWKNRTISWRLSLMATIPLMVMAIFELVYLWYNGPYEVRSDLREHGEILAAAIAENSEYGLTSGNLKDLERTVRSLVAADKWIYRIDVVDSARKPRLSIQAKDGRQAGGGRFDARVFRRTLPVDDFGSDELPHFSGEAHERVETTEVIGEVHVLLSEEPAIAKQKRRLLLQMLLLVFAVPLSVWVATQLGKALHRPMNTAIRALRDVRGGDYSVQLDVDDGGEMGELLDAINDMSRSLDEAKRNLEGKVLARTRDLEASRNEALKADAEKRRLIQKVDSAVEDERKSIAVEIHDELNATLLGARYSSRRILDMASALPASHETAVIKESAETIDRISAQLYTSARKIVRRLRPEVLDMLGLEGAVEEMLQTYESAPGAPSFTFNHAGDFSQVEGALAIAAYRLIQECVSNVVKHAQAKDVVVMAKVRISQDARVLRLGVIDDGIGFEPDGVQEGIGLIGMKERVYAFGGTLRIKTGQGAGTHIEIELPLNTDTSTKD